MPRQVRAEQTRATIIEAAADLFDQRGYESTSLSDIVEHARVTKGALYFHFAAKEDLAHEIMEFQSRTVRRLAHEVDDTGCSSLEALMRITFGLARLAVEYPVARAGLRLASSEVGVRPPLPHPYRELLDLAAVKFLGAVKEADIHPETDIDAAAHSLVSFFIGTRVTTRTLDSHARLPRRVAEMWRLLVRALVPVTRRPRYLGLAAQLERETRAL
ncbi:ScbR family autoregulator-binding transcription factor [Streptomyces sp. B93]|uniref:ScbR family autoregulator-binding transcription factor n=1 Tax=Streptomyces sp. B93 TaxID=2824875 RepID=UPI001B37D62E|nr:ScbR family autoregulator-binding transcription factor [Streptomyces sp. B93]MBQ1090411.1 TetR/AcrR family transcriptional regulator [Streptomyces sp. B93]